MRSAGKARRYSQARIGLVCAGATLVVALAAWWYWPIGASHRHLTGSADKANRIDGVAAVGRDCTRAAVPSTEVTRVPAHGTLVFRQTGDMPPELDTSAAAQCAQRPLPGTIVFYDPKPGFRGADTFGYTLAPENGRRRTVVVDIDLH